MGLQLKPEVESCDSWVLFPALAHVDHLQPTRFSACSGAEAVCGTARGFQLGYKALRQDKINFSLVCPRS